MPWNPSRRVSAFLLRPVCSSLRFLSGGNRSRPAAPKVLSSQWLADTVTHRKIGMEVLKYVHAALALPARQRLSIAPPQLVQASETEEIFIAECLAASVLRPGQWSKEALLACGAWFSRYAQLLDVHKPALLQQLVQQALLHLPNLYSLSRPEVEAFAVLIDQCRRAAPLPPEVVAAFSLRRSELASQARLVRNPAVLMALFCSVSRALHDSLSPASPGDQLLAGVVLDHLAVAIDEQLGDAAAARPAGGVVLTPQTRDFCAQVQFHRFDHPACLAAIARYFAACLESVPAPSFLDCSFMAYFLSSLRVSAPDFFGKLTAKLPWAVAAAARSPAELVRSCGGTSVPYLLAWALLAQDCAVPEEVAAVVTAFPADRDAERLGASLDALATCVEQVTLALCGGDDAGERLQWQDPTYPWLYWHAGQTRFFAESGFDVHADVGGGMRAALVSLAVTSVDGTAELRRWPRACSVAPAQVTPDALHLLPAVPVAVMPGERMRPSGRPAGPHWRKAQMMRARGWGVAFADEAAFVVDGRDEDCVRWLKFIVFKAARDQEATLQAQRMAQQQQQQQQERHPPMLA